MCIMNMNALEGIQMNKNEEVYCDLLKKILANGEHRDDRTGVGTHAIFGANLEFDLQENFPILTKKKMYLKTMMVELLWMLRGDDHIGFLKENNVKIWNEWADEDGYVGPIYGNQWRSWGNRGVDQIKKVIEDIQTNPAGRRHMVSAWNAEDLPKMNLPPCHILFQLYVTNNGCLDLQYYQRSADTFIGLPYDIALYSMLIHLICGVTGLKPGRLLINLGDTHIYNNHFEQVNEYLNRSYINNSIPKFSVPNKASIDDYTLEDFKLENYEPQSAIKAEIAI